MCACVCHSVFVRVCVSLSLSVCACGGGVLQGARMRVRVRVRVRVGAGGLDGLNSKMHTWFGTTSATAAVVHVVGRPPRAERKRGRGKGKRANPFRIGAVAFDIERTQNCLHARRLSATTETKSDRALATPKRTHASFASPRLAYSGTPSLIGKRLLFESHGLELPRA